MMRRTEETVVELPFIETAKLVGYIYRDGTVITPEFHPEERSSMKDVILQKTFTDSLVRLNPNITQSQIHEIFQKFKQIHTDQFQGNKEIYEMMTQGVKLSVDTPSGKKDKHFRIISEDPKENTYNIINQLKIHGSKKNIKPDILIYINGLPIVLTECKYSGTESQPLNAGLNQIQVYMKKAPQLFLFNQILISTYKDKAYAGTITGFPTFFNEWLDTYPFDIKTQNQQESMIWGLLHPENLTEILFNHILFEGSSKIMPRYQQYRAVRKTMKVLSQEASPKKERSGIIFHTQRSGKTYTMINLARTLHKDLPDYKIVFLVDRVDLEVQHLKTFKNTLNKPIIEIDSTKELFSELKTDKSNIVFAMIHKFRDDEVFPLLNNSSKIIVVVDEAHRSQYKLLGSNLNRALPNAPKIGFTGTPLFKNDKTTEEFGEIIDLYPRSQAIADKCTVPLKYENRLPLVDADLKAIKEDESFILSGLTKEQKEQGIKKFVTVSSLYNSLPVIKVITKDIITHFKTVVEPEGFKAMLVTESKEIAYQYHQMIKSLNGPKSTIVFSGNHNDPEYLLEFSKADRNNKDIENFKSFDGDIKILIVVDKLLTGFNAPICQTMYFCKKIKEHNLAQAIDRPVTPYITPNQNSKQFGLIIDYCGIKDDIQETIELFDKDVDKLNVYKDVSNDLELLKEAQDLFINKSASDIDLNQFEESLLKYKDNKKREELFHYYKEFNKAINNLLPSEDAQTYLYHSKKYLKFIKELTVLYSQKEELGLEDIGEKIKSILNEHVKAQKIETTGQSIDILSAEFLTKKIDKRNKTELQCAEAQYAIKKYIDTNRHNDPIFFDKLAEKVEKVLEKYKNNAKELLSQLLLLRQELLNQEKKAQTLGLQTDDLPKFNYIQDFLLKNTNLNTEDQQVIVDEIVPKLKSIKQIILDKGSEQEGLYKDSNISEIKNKTIDLLADFHDDKVDYKTYSDRLSVLASELIEKYR